MRRSELLSNDFRPAGLGGKPKGEGSAVTIAAGVFLKDLYRALGEKNLTAVVGLSHTVGAAGGYIQGGGHSPLGWWKGFAADNALEFSVVTAKVRASVSFPLLASISYLPACRAISPSR